MVALDAFYPMTGVTTQLAQWQNFSPYYFADGVIQGVLNSCVVTQHAPPGMSVDVGTGYCFLQGVYGQNGSTKQLTIAAANATNPRIDRVVLRVDTVAQDLEVLVITGTAAASPSAPAIVRSATQTDYSLAQILVGTTVTSIVTANITDERQYASPRGIPAITAVASSGTINPYSPTPLTDGWGIANVSGTTTISNIATGNLPPAGSVLALSFLSAGCQVGTGGNINLARPYISGVAQKSVLLLRFDGGAWLELARSGEQAPAHQYFGNPTGTVAAATFAAIVSADLPGYGAVTFGSLTQNVGVAYTQASGRAVLLGKQWQAWGVLTVTGTGTGGNFVTVVLPSGITLAQNTGTPVGHWRADAGSTYFGVLAASGTSVLFEMATNPSAHFGVTPNVTLANTHVIYLNITAEVS